MTTLKRIRTREAAVKAASFFVLNKTSSYISHGEILCGRATSFEKWSPDLERVVKKELIQCSRNRKKFGPQAYTVGDETIAGLVIVNVLPGVAVVEDVVISRKMRNKGIGKALFQSLHDVLSRLSVKLLLLETGAKNSKARKFFSRMGYKECATVMRKSLRHG